MNEINELSKFDAIDLTNSYKKSTCRNDFNQHIVSVLDIAYNNTKSDILTSADMKFSKALYWECINSIYEDCPIVRSDQQKEENRQFQESLYSSVINKLGSFFNINDEILLETIDFTISNYMNFVDYNNHFNEKIINPWEFSSNIFLESNLLYTFSDNIDEFSHLLKKNKTESDESKYKAIGILCKGKREDYVQKYIKDIYAVRNLFLKILDEKNHDMKKPIKIRDIYKLFRTLGIDKDDLSDSNIRYWIVLPLKDQIKIGSNKNGYFLIRTEEDLNASYQSHYKKLLGYYRTLNRHQALLQIDYPDSQKLRFELHHKINKI